MCTPEEPAPQVLSDMVIVNESRAAHSLVRTMYSKTRAFSVVLPLRYQVGYQVGHAP